MNLSVLPFLTLFLMVVVLSGRIFYLGKKGVKPISKNKQKRTGEYISTPIFMLVFLLWFFEIIRSAFQISFSLLPGFLTDFLLYKHILQLIGSGILLLSVILFSITLKDFGASLRFGLSTDNQGPIITSGIFRFSRNPFFLSLELYFIGTTLILPNIFFIGFTLTAITGIHFFILKEERFLIQTYGEEYQKYKQKVRRYL